MMRTNRGITLAEIVVVVVVLGIMAALMMPRFFSQDEKGIVAEAIGMLSAIRQGEVGYNLENGSFLAMDTTVAGDDGKWASIGLDKPSTGRFNYAVSGAGTATATRVASSADYGGKTIILNIDGSWDQTAAATHPYKPKN